MAYLCVTCLAYQSLTCLPGPLLCQAGVLPKWKEEREGRVFGWWVLLAASPLSFTWLVIVCLRDGVRCIEDEAAAGFIDLS